MPLHFYQIKQEKTINEEPHSIDSVSFSVYSQYFKAGGNWASLFFFFLSCLAFQFCYSFSHYWLSTWTRAEQLHSSVDATASLSNNNKSRYTTAGANNATVAAEKSLDVLLEMDTYTGIYGFTILTVCGLIFSVIRSIHFFIIFLKASIRLHDKMFQAIVRSPLLFFDRNPIGITHQLSSSRPVQEFTILHHSLFCFVFMYRSNIEPVLKRYRMR